MYDNLGRNRYFEILECLAGENRGDEKVAFISELDLSSVERLRNKVAKRSGLKPTYTALAVKAVALALRRLPYANRISVRLPFYRRIFQLYDADISVAVEKDEPGKEQLAYAETIRAADGKDLYAITRELRAIAQSSSECAPRLKSFKKIVEKLPTSLAKMVFSLVSCFPKFWIEHRGGAVLISSPAKYGVDAVVGTFAWPLAFTFGLVKDRVIVVDGRPAVRPTMNLMMSFNRLIMAGAPAARFFKLVSELLENAEMTLDERPHENAKPSKTIFDKEIVQTNLETSSSEVCVLSE